jgi:hypothetical protein
MTSEWMRAMTIKNSIRLILLGALVSLALAGYMIHARIHLIAKNPSFIVPFVAGILSIAVIPAPLLAQDVTIYDQNQRVIFDVRDGKIYDANQRFLGTVDGNRKSAELYDPRSRILGHVRDGKLYDKNWRLLGYEKKGVVYDRYNRVLGYIHH